MDEGKVRGTISDWFDQVEGFSVYWGEGGGDPYPNFQMETTDDRPDMLVRGESNILLELKDGNDSASIYDAMTQCHRYWSQVEFNGAKALVDGDKCEIDVVAIATQYSPEGHLFKKEREQDYRQTYEDEESEWNEDMRPQYEYARTEAVPRIMWRYAWQEAEQRQNLDRSEIGTGIGALLSSEVDQPPDQSGLDQFGQKSIGSMPKFLMYDGHDKAQWTNVVQANHSLSAGASNR